MPTISSYEFAPKEILRKMNALASKYNDKRLSFSNSLTNTSDARIFFFGNIVQLLQNKAIFLSSYFFLKENNLVISQIENIDFYGVDKLYKNLNSNIEKNIITEFQTCLLLETFIELEGFMRCLGKSLSPIVDEDKVKPLFKKIIDSTTTDTQDLNFLRVMTYLRNTIHNKGMQGRAETITCRGKDYIFKAGENSMQVVDSGSSVPPTRFNIEIMLDLIESLYEVMDKIVFTLVVSSISHIPFYYDIEDLD